MKKSKGFTLVEMLVVIAIIAVLVTIIIPTVSIVTKKAKAAADAANMRSAYGIANVALLEDNDVNVVKNFIDTGMKNSHMMPDAKLVLIYYEPACFDVYFKNNGVYYGMNYFSEVANNGSSELAYSQPQAPSGYTEIEIS